MSLAQTLVRRLAQNIARYRQTVTYRRGTSTFSQSAHVYAMPSATRYTYFLQAESASWALPAYVVVIAGDFQPFGTAPVAAINGSGDSVTLDGTAYPVRRMERVFLGPVVLKTLLFVARTA